jgi:hypothetical protein
MLRADCTPRPESYRLQVILNNMYLMRQDTDCSLMTLRTRFQRPKKLSGDSTNLAMR